MCNFNDIFDFGGNMDPVDIYLRHHVYFNQN